MALDPHFIEISRKLRKEQTPWEKKLWMHLKDRRFLGLKFRRQVVMGSYIYDFLCFEKKFIIELDGSHHKQNDQIEKDTQKQGYAERLGFTVIRFNNNDLDSNFEGVLEKLRTSLQ